MIIRKLKEHFWRLGFSSVVLTILACLLFILLPVDAFAGPGGEIVEFAFKSRIGRIIFGIAAIILLPLIMYIFIAEWLGIHKTEKALKKLSEKYRYFKWDTIEVRVREAVETLYKVWSTGDISEAQEFMTEDYYRSQQDILARWKDEGKVNVTEVGKSMQIRPLYVSVEDEENLSVLTVRITLIIVDYMKEIESGKIIKGSKKAHTDHEILWTLVYSEGNWLLHTIGKDENSLFFAKQANKFNSSYLDDLANRTGWRTTEVRSNTVESDSPVVDTTSDHASKKQESSVVGISQNENDGRKPDQNNKGLESQR